jgi:uncharacterized protein
MIDKKKLAGMFLINLKNKRNRFYITLIIATAGGCLFLLLGIPIPWLLGPMTAVLISSKSRGFQALWPRSIRDAGLVLLGYSIGLALTKEAVIQIFGKLPLMLVLTIILISFCAGIAFFVSKLSGIDYPTVLTGSIPGGLSQMITFSEEAKGIDLTVVTFLQVTRVIIIIFSVPFLISSPLFNHLSEGSSLSITEQTGSLFPNILLFAVLCVIFAFLGKKLNIPTPFLLGPIVGTAVLTISGFHGPELPAFLLDLSQFMIGSYIGLMLKPEKLKNKSKILSLAIVSGIVMVLGSLGMSLLLVHFYAITPSTSFLSLTPGGADQMAILAHEVQADISMVAGFQLFRLLFIFFAVPPFLRWVFKKKLFKNTEKPS